MASVQNLLVKIGADISGLTAGIRNATSQINQLAQQNERAFQAVGSVGKAMTIIGTAGVAGLGMAVKTAANFESAMSRVGALSGASAEELRKLTANAEEMGRKTSFSATQAAEAQQFLAMA